MNLDEFDNFLDMVIAKLNYAKHRRAILTISRFSGLPLMRVAIELC